MIKLNSFLLVDLDKELPPNSTPDQNIITYGINSNSMITATSITDDNISLCVQTPFRNEKGELIEPQELPISLMDKSQNLSDALCQGTIALILG